MTTSPSINDGEFLTGSKWNYHSIGSGQVQSGTVWGINIGSQTITEAHPTDSTTFVKRLGSVSQSANGGSLYLAVGSVYNQYRIHFDLMAKDETLLMRINGAYFMHPVYQSITDSATGQGAAAGSSIFHGLNANIPVRGVVTLDRSFTGGRWFLNGYYSENTGSISIDQVAGDTQITDPITSIMFEDLGSKTASNIVVYGIGKI